MLELLELAPPALLARKQARAPQISRSARDGDCMLRVFRTKKKSWAIDCMLRVQSHCGVCIYEEGGRRETGVCSFAHGCFTMLAEPVSFACLT
jgi:hypothetical protein